MADREEIEVYTPTEPLSVFRDYNNPQKYPYIGLFYAEMHRPLSIWEKQVRGDSLIARIPDEDDGVHSLHITSPIKSESTYVATPASPFTSLGIKLNWLTFVIMSLRRTVTITIQIRDTTGRLRRFIMSSSLFKPAQRTENSVYVSIRFDGAWAWNNIQINLAHWTSLAFDTTFQELVRVQVCATCRLRLVYSSAGPLDDDESADVMRGILKTISADLYSRHLHPFEKSYLLVPTAPNPAAEAPLVKNPQSRYINEAHRPRNDRSKSLSPCRPPTSIQSGCKPSQQGSSVSLTLSPQPKPYPLGIRQSRSIVSKR